MADGTGSVLLPPEYPDGYEFLAGYEERTVDDKGRLVMPSQWREFYGAGGRLTEWKGGLALWTIRGWGAIVAEIHAAQKDGKRRPGTVEAFRRKTQMVTVDGQGRFMLPPVLRDRVGIGGHGSMVGLDGQGDRIGLWSVDRIDGMSDDELALELADFEH
jgi:MraZ protein